MKTTEDILKELNEYYHNIPYQGLEGCHALPSLDVSEFYAYWGILRSLPKEDLSRAKDIIDKENYAEILSYVVKPGERIATLGKTGTAGTCNPPRRFNWRLMFWLDPSDHLSTE